MKVLRRCRARRFEVTTVIIAMVAFGVPLAFALGVPGTSDASASGEPRAQKAGIETAQADDADETDETDEASDAIDARFTATLSVDRALAVPGDQVEVLAEVDRHVPAFPVDADIVLLLDSSGSMAGDPLRLMKEAAKEMVTLLDLPKNPDTRLGLVSFTDTAKAPCPIANDERGMLACIRSMRAVGGTSIDAGLGRAALELTAVALTRPAGHREIVVVLTDGENNAGCPPVVGEADRIKAAGVRILAICLGTGCDSACMRRVATSPADYAEALDLDDLVPTFLDIGSAVRALPAVRSFEITVELPHHLEVDIASVSPPPAEVVDGRQLIWRSDRLDRDGATFAFRADVVDVGYAPLTLSADFELIDGFSRSIIGASEAIGDPSAPPPTSSPTIVPTSAPTSTQTPMPAPTDTSLPPTPTPERTAETFIAFIPLGYDGR